VTEHNNKVHLLLYHISVNNRLMQVYGTLKLLKGLQAQAVYEEKRNSHS